MHLIDETVRPEWIDYNGHLYDGYYAVIFAKAIDEFLIRVGLTPAMRESTRHTIYTMETHVRFLWEVKLGTPVSVTCQVLDLDAKRVRVFLSMHDKVRNIAVATSEQLLMSIDQAGEAHSAPWLPESARILEGLRQEHAALPVPKDAGRSIAIKR
ncbi:4-hydroxybenzoyl-CoA thioesterase [Labrys miyagiensis]|uniref:4-hydroxybenzoyl-CoA thioesterase n=1 Tax=Labrys miyagiensis TaxID=346912 RepID=A0ABQ6CEM5_9HYPH|nr:thioesterase family protein [Labrys miyagiensis]GLS18345.1 4-hydroxybenzoyl-CoA thioesterase [Labrys miyagiensis]